MKRSRAELTAEQVNAGRRMRECHGTSWYRIGRNLGCDPETIQRALDPGYDVRRRAARAKRRRTVREKKRHLSVEERCAQFKPTPSHRRPKAEDNDHECCPQEGSARRRATKQDDAFIEALTRAVHDECESCPIGVNTRPSTTNPRLTVAHGDGRSVTGSSAQMCADFA